MIAIILILITPFTATAYLPYMDEDKFTYRMTVGPSASFMTGLGPDGPATTLDLTLNYSFFWLSTGVKALFPDSNRFFFFPYMEVGGYLLFNGGIGYTAGFGGDEISPNYVHFFIGLPLPLDWIGLRFLGGFCIMEPYYRPMYGFGDGPNGWSHEFGMLFKWTIGWNAKGS